ncbi:MAG: LemA family protein [Clostridia bacterium]|jgi:LemA protein|nr:LemA family protein [Clostridia bacterium]
MANALDELGTDVLEEGLETKVIAKKLPVKVGTGSLIFEIVLWVLGIIPGLIFLFKKISAKNYFQQLEQKIQHNASQIDNYLEQRVMVLQNCARLVDKAVNLDQTTFESIAKYRAGAGDENRNEVAGKLDSLTTSVQVAMENYPELQAHQEIKDAMKQNMYLQREITAARELYNDTVNTWNREIFAWPTKMIVAAKNGYTTRIPFIASAEIKQKAKEVFF